MPLHAVCAADDKYRIIQYGERPLHLRGEVHMPRRIQKRYAPVRLYDSRLLGKNRNAALPLLRIIVQVGILMVYPPKLPDLSGLI